jgi:hypothetical protein
MFDPTPSAVTAAAAKTSQQLDPWQENANAIETTESTPETPEAVVEVLFDQAEVVEEQAEQYWTEHVLKRPFEADEEEFVFNQHTHTQRQEALEKNRLEKGELETSEFADPKEKQLKLIALREQKIQIIIEQAWADLSYLLSHRAKIEAETKKLAIEATSQTDIDQLKEMAVKSLHLASRLTKFNLYTESAEHLFKKYRELSPDLANLLHDGASDRYDQVMYTMLQATETSIDQDLRISGQNDRDYLTTFLDLKERISTVNYDRLSILIAARVKQLESMLAESQSTLPTVDEVTTEAATAQHPEETNNSESDTPAQESDTSNSASNSIAEIFSFADLVAAKEAQINAEAQQLEVPPAAADGSAIPETVAVSDETPLPTKSGQTTETTSQQQPNKSELEQREQHRQANITIAMKEIFTGNKK